MGGEEGGVGSRGRGVEEVAGWCEGGGRGMGCCREEGGEHMACCNNVWVFVVVYVRASV